MRDFGREVDAAVPGALNPGEEVLWKGHCLSRLGRQKNERTLAGALVGWPLSIFFTGIGVLMLVGGLTNGVVGRVIAGTLLLAIGGSLLHTLITQLFRDSKMFCRKQTVYVLTNQRALVLRMCRTAYPVQSLPLPFIDSVRVEGRQADGRGTVQFLTWDATAQRWTYPMRFYMVEHPGAIVNLARATIDGTETDDVR